jgi:hypothetical protein
MAWRSKSKKRRQAEKLGFRSGFESDIATILTEDKIEYEYETMQIAYIVPEVSRSYTPDFILPNNVIVEAKGRWTIEDRKKHLLIKEQHPELDVRIVFQNANTKIRKGSKTTYGDFCDKHGILWGHKEIPKSWYK